MSLAPVAGLDRVALPSPLKLYKSIVGKYFLTIENGAHSIKVVKHEKCIANKLMMHQKNLEK